MGLLWGWRTSSVLVLVLFLGCQREAAAQKKLKQAVEKVVKKTSTEKPKLFTGKRDFNAEQRKLTHSRSEKC